VIDRASTFANPRMVEMLREDFVPVALDQAYQRRQQDAEGAFYRRIASQGPRNDFGSTTQGFYVATAQGELLLYNNNRDPEKVRRLVAQAGERFRASAAAGEETEAIAPGTADKRYSPQPPDGGLVVRVRARVLGGYPPATQPWQRELQVALSRDNLWVTGPEHAALAQGRLEETLLRRIARFHLVDNTRGEPPMWKDAEVRVLDARLEGGRLRGTVHLETGDGARGYRAELFGVVASDGTRVTRFDVVADGVFWGEGRYTRNAPEGRFPFAVALTLADGTDVADAIPPQGSRGWVDGYLR